MTVVRLDDQAVGGALPAHKRRGDVSRTAFVAPCKAPQNVFVVEHNVVLVAAFALDDGGVPERCFPSRCFHLPQSRIDPIADGDGARAGRQFHGSDKGPRGTRREAFSAGRGINRRYIFVAIFIVSRRFREVVRADDSAVAEPQWEHLIGGARRACGVGSLRLCVVARGSSSAGESDKAARQQ